MLRDLNVKKYPEDKVSTFPDPSLNLGSKIILTRATKVTVTDAKVATVYRTWKETVGELLKEKKIELLGQDSANPGIASKLSYGMGVRITRVAEVDVTEKEAIDFKVIKRNSVDLEKGRSEIETKGVKGEKEVVYTIKRVDGIEVSRVIKESKVIKESVTEVQIIGIGPKLAKSGPYKDIVNAAAKEYLINGTALMCLMLRESNGHADSGVPDGMYQGLFQYDPGYWETASSQAGYGGSSITNPTAQIFTTAYQLTHGQSRRWPPWGSCSNL